MTKTQLALLAAAVVVACDTDPRTPTQPGLEGSLAAPADGRSALAWDRLHEPGPRHVMRGLERSGGGGDSIDPILYKGGPIIYTPKVAVLYWSNRTIYSGGPTPNTSDSVGAGSADGSLIGFVLNNIGGSNYQSILTTYYDNTNTYVQNSVHYTQYWASANSAPAAGDTAYEGIFRLVLETGFANGFLTFDPDSTIYVIVTDSAVDWVGNGGDFKGGYFCAFHDTASVPGYGSINFVALPHQYDESFCVQQSGSPNNDPAGDAAIQTVVHEVEESTTDPKYHIANGKAWQDDNTPLGQEMADKCYPYFLPDYSVTGGFANVFLGPGSGGKNFFIQRLWKNVPAQQCAFYSLIVSGPSTVDTGTYTWTANPAGSASSYTYQWQEQNLGSTWNALSPGNAQSQSFYVGASQPSFSIRVITTNSVSQSQADSSFYGVLIKPSISGPSRIRPNQTCTWNASATGGSGGGYTYSWTADGASIGTGTPLMYSSSSSFTLGLTATDNHNNSGSTTFGVTVSSSAPNCPQIPR